MSLLDRNVKIEFSLKVMNSHLFPHTVLEGGYQNTMLRNNKKNHPLVLLFSKDYETCILLKAFLNVWNYEVCEAANEADLLQVAESRNPALILFDLSLSLADDLEILRRTRATAQFKNLPVLVLSGHARFRDSNTALQAGASEYLLKPIDFEWLENSIKKYCSEYENNHSEDFGGIL